MMRLHGSLARIPDPSLPSRIGVLHITLFGNSKITKSERETCRFLLPVIRQNNVAPKAQLVEFRTAAKKKLRF